MAPNIVNGESDKGVIEENKRERKEIYFNGYFYDVTDFIRRHPGGNVIKFYTERGEDATQAIEQFHFRNRKKVDRIMKSLKKRLAEPHERGLEPKSLTRHEALSSDFKKLFEDLQNEGYFKPSIPHVILRLVECLATTLFTWGIFLQCETLPAKFLAVILCGFGSSRYGWLMHEGGHRSLTGKPKIDKIIENFAMCFILGGSSSYWNFQHNRHHAMPQRVNRDVDIATLPFITFSSRAVKDKKEIVSFLVKYQAFFYVTLDILFVQFAWRLFLHPQYLLHKKAYFEMLLTLPNLYWMWYLGPVWFTIHGYFFAIFLFVNFALNHSHLEVTEKPTHWVEYALTHTANIKGSLLVDYIMGYLNYQIEHHLFPNMPQFRQKEIMPRVKALAKKHELPYMVFGYTEACRLAIKNLNDVGKEVTGKDYFSKKE